MHATFWLGIEQCSNRRQANPVRDMHTIHVPETSARKWSGFRATVSVMCITAFMDLTCVVDREFQVEKARHVLLLREKLSEQERTVELSKLDKDALNKYRRLTAAASTLLSDKERERSSSEIEKSTDDLHSVLDTCSDPSKALIVKCLKLMLNNRRETRARLLAEVIAVLWFFSL